MVIRKEEIAGIRLLRIQQLMSDKKVGLDIGKNAKKAESKLRKIVKRYYDKESVIIANELFIKEQNLPNVLFEARKKELLMHRQDIFQWIQERKGVQRDRRGFLLVVDSILWDVKEIVDILVEVINYYEDIYFVVHKSCFDLDYLVAFFYEEYGLIIHIVSDEMVKKENIEAALLLVEEWNKCAQTYPFEIGYIVAEWENNMMRHRKCLRNVPNQVGRELYSGFVYEKEKRTIPYELALALVNRSQEKYNTSENQEQIKISIVAIYSVE